MNSQQFLEKGGNLGTLKICVFFEIGVLLGYKSAKRGIFSAWRTLMGLTNSLRVGVPGKEYIRQAGLMAWLFFQQTQ